MIRFVLLILFALQIHTAHASYGPTETTKRLSQLPVMQNIEMVICGDLNQSLTFYWIAVEEGLSVALEYYSLSFFYKDCRYQKMLVIQDIYFFCTNIISEKCAGIPVKKGLLEEYGVIVP